VKDKRPRIEWEKYYPSDDLTNDYDKEPEPEEEYSDSYEEDGKRILLNMGGQIHLEDHLAKSFDIWILHGNFDLDTEAEAIYEIEGVEHVSIMSRYRLKISFGKLFDSAETKGLIQRYLIGANASNLSLDEEHKKMLDDIRGECSRYKNWAIFMFPNGRVVSSVTNEESIAHLDKVELFKETRTHVGGHLLISEDVDAT